MIDREKMRRDFAAWWAENDDPNVGNVESLIRKTAAWEAWKEATRLATNQEQK